MNIIKKIAAAGALALVLAGCSGGINSEEEALDVLQNSNSHEERLEAAEYLMEQGSSVEEAMAVPAPVTIEFNEPVEVTTELKDSMRSEGYSSSQVDEQLREYDGDPRIIRLSAGVTNTSDEALTIPDWGVGFDAYEGAGQFPVDSYNGISGFGDITGIDRMPTLIQPGETVEFANSYVFTQDDEWTVTFNWNDDEGRTATATETLEAP